MDKGKETGSLLEENGGRVVENRLGVGIVSGRFLPVVLSEADVYERD